MEPRENESGPHSAANFFQLASLVALLLHFYYYFLPAFTNWGLRNIITDRLLDVVVKFGFYSNVYKSKGIAIGILLVSLFSAHGKKDENLTYRGPLILMCVGLLLYFGSVLMPPLMLGWQVNTRAIVYMLVSLAGYLLVFVGGIQLSRIIGSSFRKVDILNRENQGFPHEKKLRITDYSINLPGVTTFRGKEEKCWINFINCRRGLLIIGSSGSGKSWFIIENVIRQFSRKAFALFVFDYKFPDLTLLTYNRFLANKKCYPKNTRFYTVQVDDPSRSHRCNLIHPDTMTYIADATGVSETIFLSLNKSGVEQNGFFLKSAVNFFAAVIWFLKKYKNGMYCTLPHAIELAQVEYSQLFTILRMEPEIRSLISSFINAFENKSMEMLDGQVATAVISLGKMASPNVYYVFSGNDFSLDINNPAAPKIVCLGSNPQQQEGLAPVLSVFIDRLNKIINKKDQYKCAVICDEFTTVRATSLMTTMAVARSNNIVPVIAFQEFHMLEDHFTSHEAKKILNMTGNLVCGQVGGDTARMVSERFPKTMQDRRGMSTNSLDTSFNSSQALETDISPATIAGLSSGEFVGLVADDPDERIQLKAFHARIINDKKALSREKASWRPLPVVRQISQGAIDRNFRRISREVNEIVRSEMERIMGDPTLSGLRVRRD